MTRQSKAVQPLRSGPRNTLLTTIVFFAWAAAARAADEPPALQMPETLRWLDRLDVRLEANLSAPLKGTGRGGVAVELAPRPDYWYAVELATGTEATVRTFMGSDDRFLHEITYKDRLLLSARIFKRFGPLVLNGGMIDGHGGFGAELRALDDKLRVEVMFYDRSDFLPLRVRTAGSAQWRWLFVQAGLQDVIDPRLRTPYVGAGLRWRDPDLKSVAFWLP